MTVLAIDQILKKIRLWNGSVGGKTAARRTDRRMEGSNKTGTGYYNYINWFLTYVYFRFFEYNE